ncbi:MAG: DUF2283 domain-containing protein [Dehalococcoidia bacterium]
MIAMEIRYDTEADAMFIWFRERGQHPYVRIIDDVRFLRMDDDGIAGVEFLDVSRGMNLDAIPHADEIREALRCMAMPAA